MSFTVRQPLWQAPNFDNLKATLQRELAPLFLPGGASSDVL